MFFLQQLGYLVFLQVSSTLFSIFSVPRVPWAYFGFSLRLVLLALFVHVFHFNRSFLFWFVCVPFGSGSQYFVWSEILLYAVLARSAPGPCIGHIYGPGPFHPRSRLNICQRLLLYGLTAHLDLAYGRFRIFLQSISLVYTGIVTLWQ